MVFIIQAWPPMDWRRPPAERIVDKPAIRGPVGELNMVSGAYCTVVALKEQCAICALTTRTPP